MISSPPGPSGGPFMTHLLPCGGVLRVHGAWSPVPPRLPDFAALRSVRHLATLVAGAYPLRRPPDAWSPRVLAPPGPCYWLVTSGTPNGWRRGCPAVGLVRSTVCHYCLGGCIALVVCVRLSRQVLGVGAGGGSRISPERPPLPPRSPRLVWRVVPSACPFSSSAGTPFHVVCAFRGLGPVSPQAAPRALCVCVRLRSRGVRALCPSPSQCGARTSRPSGAGRR